MYLYCVIPLALAYVDSYTLTVQRFCFYMLSLLTTATRPEMC